MTALERAAYAMREACRPDVTNPESVTMLQAALRALREPPDEIWEAFDEHIWATPPDGDLTGFGEAWSAAIDSILAEQPGDER